jgi:hypothetical protein
MEPMLLLRTDKLPEGTGWQYEVKIRRLPRTGDQERGKGPTALPMRRPYLNTIGCNLVVPARCAGQQPKSSTKAPTSAVGTVEHGIDAVTCKAMNLLHPISSTS